MEQRKGPAQALGPQGRKGETQTKVSKVGDEAQWVGNWEEVGDVCLCAVVDLYPTETKTSFKMLTLAKQGVKTCNLSIWEGEAGPSGAQNLPGLHIRYKASLGYYRRPCYPNLPLPPKELTFIPEVRKN